MTKFWAQSYGGFTVEHNPVMLLRIGASDFTAVQNDFTEEERLRFYIWFLENGLEAQREGMARAQKANMAYVPGQVEVYDFIGLSPSSVPMSGLVSLARLIASCGSKYPGNLRRACVLNAPYGFESLWSVISMPLSKAVSGAFDFKGDEARDVLEPMMGSKEACDALLASVPQAEVKSWGEWAT